MRVHCILEELRDDLGWSKRDLAHSLGIDPRTLDKLLLDGSWQLSCESYARIMKFAYQHGYEHGAFELRPNPIWETFDGRIRTNIFRGSSRVDADIESQIRKFLAKLGSDAGLEQFNCDDRPLIQRRMKTSNCVFIGSPKKNRATEVALALLWEAEPFISSEENQRKIHLWFLGMRELDGRPVSESAVLRNATYSGLEILSPHRKRRRYMPVTWCQVDEYREFIGKGEDAAAVVVQRKPLGTSKSATSIIIAGFTGMATLLAANHLINEEVPFPEKELAESQEPLIAALRFSWEKRRRCKNSTGGYRRLIEGSEVWGPPWRKELFAARPV